MNKNSLLLFLIMIGSFSLFSQGLEENPLTVNSVLIKKQQQLKSVQRLPSIYDTISLGTKGILDDFSNEGPYPDTTFWLDKNVFINGGYAKAPITIGVATFDGLDSVGYPYNFLMGSGSTGIADYLTSKPIRLNYPDSDSIYFSFYYQPQGLGNAPEQSDSLVLEFKGPGSLASWDRIWAKKGKTLAINDSSWTLVMIPITDTTYLKDGFQFRFKNYATLSGSLDHWNIDYVYLNKVRNQNDTVFEDISFVYNNTSLLTEYAAMPWRHYTTADMKTAYATSIRNNHNAIKNGSFTYAIFDETNTQVNTTYSGGNINIDPFNPNGYLSYAPFSAPALNYSIPVLTDSSGFTIECAVNSTPDFYRGNDTIRYVQEFANHYAYDDGTAESALGLSTLYAQLAGKFTSTTPDTLRCIDIYFNPIITNVEPYTFRLKVWSASGSIPGTAVFTSDTTLYPEYGELMPNQFTRYYLDAPVYLNAGTFFIGFIQNTNQFLNVGLDKNSDSSDKVYYNITGGWALSPYPGSVMMRPVFGPASDFTGINTISKKDPQFTVYPNPASDKLFLKSNNATTEKTSYSIIDVSGRVLLTDALVNTESIDISMLSNGIYFISISTPTKTATQKFVVAN
jgi:hypothetical protein